MARVSTALTLVVLTMSVAVLLIPRESGTDRQTSFATSGVDMMPVGSISRAAKARRERDSLAP